VYRTNVNKYEITTVYKAWDRKQSNEIKSIKVNKGRAILVTGRGGL
jgi:hypothetical protein